MRIRNWISGISVFALAWGILAVAPFDVQAAEIPDGVYVGEYNLGGMTKEEADEAINSYVDEWSNQKITLDIDGTPVETTAAELGFHWSNKEALDEAASLATSGNLIQRYMAMKDIEVENIHLPLETKMDESKISAFVEEKCTPLAAAAQDASITRADGKFVITPSVKGMVVDIEATRNALNEALNQGIENPITVTAVVAEAEPAITTESLSSIQDVLGTFTTSFSSSGAARSKNLEVGAAKINGRILMPGQTLSGYECMQPFTTSNGYATAAAYENGMVVDSVGGGVCQISTTLYNAALQAELDIPQRQNHSMVVNYVDHSADAAIAGTFKDLKITNNYSTPIYVEGYTSGRKLTFTVYGKETRPANRVVKYVSETLGVTDPGAPILKEDPGLAPGKRVTEQSAHRGVRSRLWKVVTVDGQETERTLLHTDTYNASKAIVRVGPEPVAVPQPIPEPTEAVTDPIIPPTPETPVAPVTEPATGEAGGPGIAEPVPAETEPAGPGV